jgi:DNA repair exonuclease SbcCD ATPase subunit
MTSSKQPIQRLRVEAFRGFRDTREFDLSASAVIVTGPNGTGKTSFFDALQWCLLGTIQRLEGLRSRRNVEHILNQYRLGRKAVVELDLVIEDEPLTLRRSGDHSGSTLELRRPGTAPIFGAEASEALRDLLLPNTDLSLDAALTTSGLMQQDVMRGILEAKPAERYRHLTTVLGLGQLEEFEEATRSLASEAAKRANSAKAERDRIAEALRQARERLAAAQTRLESLPQIEAMREEISTYLSASPATVEGPTVKIDLTSQDAVKALAAQFGSALDEVTRSVASARRYQDLQASLQPRPTAAESDSLLAARVAAETDLETSRANSKAIEDRLLAARSTAAEMAQLAALAIPQLTDVCPVCGQAIDPAHIEAELRSRAEDTQSIVALQTSLEAAKDATRAAESRLSEAQLAAEAVQARLAQWEQFRSVRAQAEESLTRLSESRLVVRPSAASVDDLAQAADSISEYLTSRRSRLLEFLNAFDQQHERGIVERSIAETANLERALASSESSFVTESKRSQQLKQLSDQSVTSRVEVTEERVRAMQPLVANIFQRLDPHPAFKTIEFELDTYYRQGTTSPLVRDIVEGISADPLVVFSTSQANIVALSYFIAMSLSSGDRGLPFLLLDDPVQSMDDVNVLGFADLCRHLQSRRQLIVSTHERRFAGLLERKLAPRTDGASTKLIRFAGWDRSGPQVDQEVIAPQLLDDPIRVVHLAG